MKINPNLHKGNPNYESVGKNTGHKGDNYNYTYIKFENADILKGETYTFSMDIEQTENGSGFFEMALFIYPAYKDIRRYEVDKRASYTFVYDKDYERVIFYTDRAGYTRDVGAKFKNIKLEKGDQMTPYLPHKSKVKAENQAIFPPEGEYKEISPS